MATHTVKRAFKYRFYPTDAQAAELSRTFGCVRLVYNHALTERTRVWSAERRGMSYNQTSAALTQWKRNPELAFLNEVSSVPLQQALRHLQRAFRNFRGQRAQYPRLKSRKKSKAAAEYTRSGFAYRNGTLTLAKMSGPLDIVWSRPLPENADPSTVTVSQERDGRWFVTLLCQDDIRPHPATDRTVGVDVGLSALVTLSTGERIDNPRHERHDRKRLARAQRTLSRKTEGSANRGKARGKVARAHARVRDRRRDLLHKLSTRLVRENQVVVIEDLSVRGMLGNRRLSRAISDAAWSQLRAMLEYKCAWYGRELVVVDRFFPSSRMCSTPGCGHLHGRLPLNVRTWRCKRCGITHDRDINAARNLEAAGQAASACGAGVRPERDSSRSGQPAKKQETRRVTAGTPSP